MRQVTVINAAKSFGSNDIFSNITFSVDTGERLGIVGANGSGKTTLLHCLIGNEGLSAGNLRIDPKTVIGFVPQKADFDRQVTVMEVCLRYIKPLEEKLRKAEQDLSEEKHISMETLLNRYQQIRDAWDSIEGDTASERAETLLTAMGLGDRLSQEAATLSGGEKSVLLLTSALVRKPDLLILDEPGNHLDIQGFNWLEEFLQNFQGSIITVSHNRYFLDRICSSILELQNGTGTLYSGNYSDYRFRLMQKAVSQQNQYNQQQRKIRQLEEMVRRFREIASALPDPAWGKRLQAAKSRLEHEKDHAVGQPNLAEGMPDFSLEQVRTKGTIALEVNDFTVEVGNKVLVEKVEMYMLCGEKAGLIGANGSGKTTLLRSILENNDWNSPVIRIGPSLTIGFVAQHPRFPDDSRTIEDEIRSWGPLTRDQAYNLIRPLNFSWEELRLPLAGLSGGELRRIQLARCMYDKASFLILDEPTNHLDLPSREAVEEALIDYNGTILVVSHDRYFLDRIAGYIYAIEGNTLKRYEGNFTSYWKEACRTGSVQSGFSGHGRKSEGTVRSRGKERNGSRDGNQDEIKAAQQKGRTGNNDLEQIRIDDVERRILEAENERRLLEKTIQKAFSAGDNQTGKSASVKLEKLNRRIAKLYNEWEMLF